MFEVVFVRKFRTNYVRFSLNFQQISSSQQNSDLIFVWCVLKFNLFYEYSFELIEKETERVERVNAKSKH